MAAGGGAKSDLWLKIKASAYGVPLLVPSQPEGGVIGCAALAAAAEGRFTSPVEAAEAFVKYEREIVPDPAWSDVYARMQPVFERVYSHAQPLYDELDQL